MLDAPKVLKALSFEHCSWQLSPESIIEIQRDHSDYSIKCFLKGHVDSFKGIQEIPYIGEGNLVEGQKIWGVDEAGYRYELRGCLLGSYNTSSQTYLYVEAEIQVDSIEKCIAKPRKLKEPVRMEWFICNDFKAKLWQITHRNPSLRNKKIRIGIDDFKEDNTGNFAGGLSSKDYALIKFNNDSFILSLVPDEVMQGNFKGICLEFRNQYESTGKEKLNGITSLLSFLLGNQLTHIGYSIMESQVLQEAGYYGCKVSDAGGTMPPIRFNTRHEWGNLSDLIQQLLPKFLELKDKFAFEDALSRYWIARDTPLGANLPVLASAVEIMAQAYLKYQEKAVSDYLPKDEYLFLIGEELQSIKAKLKGIKGYEIIVSKISGDFRKGINEKLHIFFECIGIPIGTREKEALNLRNKMVHGSRDYSKKENIHKDLILSRVYEVLFHRILLKMLGYTEYYMDYSMEGCPSKLISKPAGE